MSSKVLWCVWRVVLFTIVVVCGLLSSTSYALECRDLSRGQRVRFEALVARLPQLRERANELTSKHSSPQHVDALAKVYDETIDIYEQLRVLCGDGADVLYNLARVQEKAGMCHEARSGYTSLAQKDPKKSAIWAQVVSLAKERLSTLEDPCNIVTYITCAQKNVLLHVDGKAVGGCPARLRLVPGRHTIEATIDGFLPWSLTQEVVGGVRVHRVAVPKLRNKDEVHKKALGAFDVSGAHKKKLPWSVSIAVAPRWGFVSGELFDRDNVSFKTPRHLDEWRQSLATVHTTLDLGWMPTSRSYTFLVRFHVDAVHPSVAGSLAWRKYFGNVGSSLRFWAEASLGFGDMLMPVTQAGIEDVVYINRTGLAFARACVGVDWSLHPKWAFTAGLGVVAGAPNFGVLWDVGNLGLRYHF